jgi:hypothetical protein
MKRIVSTCLAFIGFSLLMAQSTDVPAGVKIAFKDKFKSTVVEWTASQQSYIAKWDNSNKHMTAYYSKDAQPVLIRTETDVDVSELSTGSQTVVKERFMTGGAYTFIRCFKVEGFADTVEGCEFKIQNGGNCSVFFDANGVMTKREIN